MNKIYHYRCPKCGRLCSVPWKAAWCTHFETAQPSEPEYEDFEWARMLPIVRVDTEDLPPEADEYYVVEQRNNYGYPNDEIPGEDKRTWKVIAGPLSRQAAYKLAENHPRDEIEGKTVPPHVHYFRVIPGDLKHD